MYGKRSQKSILVNAAESCWVHRDKYLNNIKESEIKHTYLKGKIKKETETTDNLNINFKATTEC